MSEQGAPVVVTTEHRGVFFGYLDGSRDSETALLRDAQMCVYWSADVRGVLGLAATGPSVTSSLVTMTTVSPSWPNTIWLAPLNMSPVCTNGEGGCRSPGRGMTPASVMTPLRSA